MWLLSRTFVSTLGSSRNDELDQEWPIARAARGEEIGELFQRLCARRFHAHAGRADHDNTVVTKLRGSRSNLKRADRGLWNLAALVKGLQKGEVQISLSLLSPSSLRSILFAVFFETIKQLFSYFLYRKPSVSGRVERVY